MAQATRLPPIAPVAGRRTAVRTGHATTPPPARHDAAAIAAGAASQPRTEAARRELERAGEAAASDLVFLERWESDAPLGIAATLRAAQIRRANRDLCAEIHAELHGSPRAP